MRKKALFFAVLLAACTALPVKADAEVPEISAKAAAVYAPQTGTMLFDKNADERMLVASTTKIMTALVVLENCALDEKVEVSMEDASVEGSSMYLRPGGDYTVEDLLYGLLLASGNDAASALARHTAGTIDAFAGLMNEKCAALGLQNSHFVNPHGLDDEEHYSSARDLALITAAAMKNEEFRTVFSAKSHMVGELVYTNHNKLLDYDSRCTGGKTGYTEHAGRILVSAAESGGLELICVTISDPDDWRDHTLLYDAFFSGFRFIPVLEGETRLDVISGTRESVALSTPFPGFLVPADSQVRTALYLPPFAFAPVRAGGKAGEFHAVVDGQTRIVPILYGESVFIDGRIPLRPWERFGRLWHGFRLRSRAYGVYYPV